MLTENQKEKIKLTETYRAEVMAEITKNKEKKLGYFRYLSYLDSKLVIWLISVIFATGGLKIYEDYKIKVIANYANQEAVDRLDLEISYKFSRLFTALDEIENEIEDESTSIPYDQRREVQNIVQHIAQFSGTGGEYLYQEYAHRSLLSLVVEQRRKLIQLNREVSSLDEVIAKLADISSCFEGKDIDYSDIPAMKRLIANELMLPAWSRYGF